MLTDKEIAINNALEDWTYEYYLKHDKMPEGLEYMKSMVQARKCNEIFDSINHSEMLNNHK